MIHPSHVDQCRMCMTLLAGFSQLSVWLLAPVVGRAGWLPHLAGLQAYLACSRAMAAAGGPTARSSAKRIGILSFMLYSAAYWLPIGQAFWAVGAAMLLCPSQALLPPALLNPAVLWQLVLVMLAGERWLAGAFESMAALVGVPPPEQCIARCVAMCEGRFGRWLPDSCLYTLAAFRAQVCCLLVHNTVMCGSHAKHEHCACSLQAPHAPVCPQVLDLPFQIPCAALLFAGLCGEAAVTHLPDMEGEAAGDIPLPASLHRPMLSIVCQAAFHCAALLSTGIGVRGCMLAVTLLSALTPVQVVCGKPHTCPQSVTQLFNFATGLAKALSRSHCTPC